MRRLSAAALLFTAACFGSLSSDPSPSGPILPEGPTTATPPPPAAPTLGPIRTLTVSAPGTLMIGGNAQVAVTARDAEGRVVPISRGQYDVFASPASIATLSDGLLLTGVSAGFVTIQAYMRDGSATTSKPVRIAP